MLSVRFEKELIDSFEVKCEEIGLSKEIIIADMIKEWLI